MKNKTNNSRKHPRRDGGRESGPPLSAIDTSEIPEVGARFFANAIAIPGRLRDADLRAALGIAAPKEMISIRVDADVLDYFRKRGKGYQRMMNFALRAFMWREQQAEAREQTTKHPPRAAAKKASRRRASGIAG